MTDALRGTVERVRAAIVEAEDYEEFGRDPIPNEAKIRLVWWMPESNEENFVTLDATMGDLRALVDAADALTAQLQEAREDGKRLEWLATHGGDFCYTSDATIAQDGDKWHWRTESQTIAFRTPHPTEYMWDIHDADTIREGIDKAMALGTAPQVFPANHKAILRAARSDGA